MRLNLLIVHTIFLLLVSLYVNEVQVSGAAHDSDSKNSKDDIDAFSEEYEHEIREKQHDARKHKFAEHKKKSYEKAVKRVMSASTRETCDFLSDPIASLKGEICGSHYKVLGLNRKKLLDKPTIKKAYRLQSLAVHPDKNPSPESQLAFKLVQDAYSCLSDDSCKDSYDNQLALEEENLAFTRQSFKQKLFEKSLDIASKFYYHLSVAAMHVYKTGLSIWDWAGEWSVTLFDEEWKFGKHLLLGLLIFKGRFLLIIHAISFAIVRLNYEVARRR